MHDILDVHEVESKKHLMDDLCGPLLCEAIALLLEDFLE